MGHGLIEVILAYLARVSEGSLGVRRGVRAFDRARQLFGNNLGVYTKEKRHLRLKLMNFAV